MSAFFLYQNLRFQWYADRPGTIDLPDQILLNFQ